MSLITHFVLPSNQVCTTCEVCDGGLFSGSLDRSVLRWDIGTGKIVSELISNKTNLQGQILCESGSITSLCSSEGSSQSPLLYTAANTIQTSEQGTVREWDVKTGTLNNVVKIGSQVPWCIVVDDSRLFVSCDDNMAKMWDLDSDWVSWEGVGGCGTGMRDCTNDALDGCAVS